nr:glycosyltransferase WbuB [Lachnospiraceae bacterium]
CDVGMILLDHRFTIPNYPSRILGIMEMKKPVLACTDRNTDIRLLVESEAKCGLWSSSDDRESFVGNVLRLSDDADLRVRLGNNGYRYLKENFTAERSADIIEGLFAGKVLSKGEKYV